jgi:hypothetical protein
MAVRQPGKRAVLLACAIGLLAAGLFLLRAPAEHAIRARLEREARQRGLTLRIARVRAGLFPLVSLEGVRVEKDSWSLEAEAVAVSVQGRAWIGRARLLGPAELSVEVAPTVWQVAGRRALVLRDPVPGLRVEWSDTDRTLALRAERVRFGDVLTVTRAGVPLVDPGTGGATVVVRWAAEHTAVELDLAAESLRVAALDEADGEGGVTFGPPAAVRLSLRGTWDPQARRLDVPAWRLSTPAASAAGALRVIDPGHDAEVELAVQVERVDFARLLHLSALDPPTVAASEAGRPGALGSAALEAAVRGRLAEPASFRVTQKLDFEPPPRPLPALERLRGPFVHEAAAPGGPVRVEVSPDSPDFVALDDVPPLFVQALLLGEDYGFYGHRGVDLAELPAALITNWRRGGAARGASTITQQLAKNLFLTRDKTVGRKLQELSLALLLESTLDKRRILEIYLNVIEWGPGLYGLRPASRHYFGVEPRELAVKQMAFLVALIPGPRKYQRSFAGGTLSPGFRPLVDNLLAKLRSVDAITEEEYRQASSEELYVLPAGAGAGVTGR